jgi:tRNA (uracil-5-)-methyltransferase TRM9
MNSATAQRLLTLNHDFYALFGADFSATRQRLQPGVTRILGTLTGDESILDLGCGNGELARTLARRGHRGSYLGLDFSLPLLSDASAVPEGFSARFVEADLTKLSVRSAKSPDFASHQLSGQSQSPQGYFANTLDSEATWSLITCFATLHHIPSRELRVQLIGFVRDQLAANGKFILSNWQFLNSDKLRARLQPWERIGLSATDVDEGDYLLDWRRGGEGLRYAHQFSEAELAGLARECGFEVAETFYSDGEGGRLGLYQVWNRKDEVSQTPKG